MRTRVWMVLGLVGMAPLGAGAASKGDTKATVIELPARGAKAPQGKAAARSQPSPKSQAIGGSGRSTALPTKRLRRVETEDFVGALRAVEGDRLRMVDPQRRVFEFSVSNQTRLVGPDGAPVSRQALQEGVPVRAMTRGGEFENKVLVLQVLELPRVKPR